MRYSLVVLAIGFAALANGQDLPSPHPGPAHKILAKNVGIWESKVKMFFEGPDGPPSEYPAIETNLLVSGDLFLRTSFKCDLGGRAFEGNGLMGYDSRLKKYVGTWVDSFSPVPAQLIGEYDEKEGTFTVQMLVVDEAGNEIQQKQVTKWIDESNKKVTMYVLVIQDGKVQERKFMEINAAKQR